MLRIRQGKEWFADVPKACGLTSGTITLQSVEGRKGCGEGSITLTGHVLSVTPDAVVVSCGGLLARARNNLNLSKGDERSCRMVRVLIRRSE